MTTIQEFVESIPTPEELRQRLAANLEERDLLKKTIQLAEQRERLREQEGRADG